MTKKHLRQRLLDIAAGAGMEWVEQEEYWEYLCPEALSRFMEGLVKRFGLKRDSYLVHFANLDRYEHLDTLLNFFWDSSQIKGDL